MTATPFPPPVDGVAPASCDTATGTPISADTFPDLVAALSEALLKRGWRMASAESCTGGWVAMACTDRAGSSDWFERGWVTYSNTAKTEELGVDPSLLRTHGAVSAPVAQAMAEGARRQAGAEAALSITGIAGPSGGSAERPVGTVWFGWALPDRVWTECCRFDGERTEVRHQAARHAIQVLVAALNTTA